MHLILCSIAVLACCCISVRAESQAIESILDGSNCPDVYALGDVHGDLEGFWHAVTSIGLVSAAPDVVSMGGTHSRPRPAAWLKGEAVFVQMGDILDRGPDGPAILEILEEISALAQSAGGEVVRILGNHELMNMQRHFQYVHRDEAVRWFRSSEERNSAFSDTFGTYYRSFVDKFRVVHAISCHGLVFAHGGLTAAFLAPFVQQDVALSGGVVNGTRVLEAVADSAFAALSSGRLRAPILHNEGPLWTRAVANPGPRQCVAVQEALRSLGDRPAFRSMVVGHTPQNSRTVGNPCDGAIFLIDTLSSRHYGGTRGVSKPAIVHWVHGQALPNVSYFQRDRDRQPVVNDEL